MAVDVGKLKLGRVVNLTMPHDLKHAMEMKDTRERWISTGNTLHHGQRIVQEISANRIDSVEMVNVPPTMIPSKEA